MQMIKSALEAENIHDYNLCLIQDKHANIAWLYHVMESAGAFDIVYTRNPLVKEIFEGAGFHVKEQHITIDISGEKIRKMIAHDEIEWRHYVPQAVRKVVRDLYNLYRIRTIMGSWLGFWEYPCPLYGDRAFREKVKKEVLEMVNLYKDEPGVLFWTLGNENNYSCSGEVNPWSSDEIDKEPDPQKKRVMRFRTYYSFVNELAREIHQADPHHPVALGNGELKGLEFARESAPDVDLIACIIYRGKTFGNLFKSLRFSFDRPVMLAEFGADAFNAYLKKEDQNMQAFFLESQWRQIYGNLAGNPQGAGNCLGGTSFEWLDEWLKHNESSADGWSGHDTETNWQNSSYYFDSKEGTKNMNEEWFGIVSLSPETENGLHKRVPRKAYYVIREFWKNPVLKSKIKK